MRRNWLILYISFTILPATLSPSMLSHSYTYLALGDSYTIGEGLPVAENFPYQTIQLLRKSGLDFHAAEIVAKTGWTTDELQKGIDSTLLKKQYDIVTLLIGVNNQYRGRSVEEYAGEFESLLKQAIHFAGDNPARVFVLSIPDWGVTPFAEGRDRQQIADEINQYNTTNKIIAGKYLVHYIDITPGTREALNNRTLLAADNLHPSGKEYGFWAERLATGIEAELHP
ncbi:SGNH/GDSL hydrolase family protein [Pseudoflavitalea rhizosphaerae]|uniref:SGNH/GDSL hydrolase family protein n=1 Tax=Pseudoflavitalea rhizosphaerae TaxID=1884793 RepID=UPI001F496FAC|nr:SGNH/GDSL hydrolase family protein [Pseudoflavitalea rhizosphaerae]